MSIALRRTQPPVATHPHAEAYDPLLAAEMAASLTGRPVIASPYLRDGTVLVDATAVLVGTRPLDAREAAAREARLLVRRGMADVLVALGQPVCNEPTGAEILADLAALARGPVRGRHTAA